MFFSRVYPILALYGATRKTIMLQSANVSYYNEETKKTSVRPILLVDKMVIITVCGFGSIFLWPYFIYNDLLNLELKIKKRSLQDYGLYKNPSNNILDLIFS